MPNGNFKIKFEPVGRVKINDLVAKEPFYLVDFTTILVHSENLDEEAVLLKMVTKELAENAQILFRDAKKVMDQLQGGITSDKLCDLIASELKISENERAKYLVTTPINKRLQFILEDIEKRRTFRRSNRRSTNRSASRPIRTKRNLLSAREDARHPGRTGRQQARRRPEASGRHRTIRHARRRQGKGDEGAQALRILKRELERDHSVVRTYLETLISIPWQKTTVDEGDINVAIAKLEAAHYGLDKVKERIIEYLAVRKLNGKNHAADPVPRAALPASARPRSARSIARALGRKFVRMSLGGVRDEAEIRGHRRTYIGALPGRIIQGMLKAARPTTRSSCSTRSTSWASTSAATPARRCLEVLDPEQNHSFRDHYLEVTFDLSQGHVHRHGQHTWTPSRRPLRDRMEVIAAVRLHRGREAPHRRSAT
ncbi:MAG: LON peptidase substrate-binding domain-containing protein [Anaerotruncus sp.]|nr:LON peptidase substrate-binding domain-containing protein [Anaerotruncus sp.]